MVQRYEACHKHFDQWDEFGYYTCEPARDGEWVKYSTFVDETARLNAQIERLKKQLRLKTETATEPDIFE